MYERTRVVTYLLHTYLYVFEPVMRIIDKLYMPIQH